MKEIDSRESELEIKRYLYGEMSDEECALLEEKFFDDDALFFEAVNMENQLVDLYARGKFPAAEIARFERSLENLPERRAKIANAVALQSFIAEEKPQEKHHAAAATANQTFWQKISEFFIVQTPAFSYAMAGLLFLLMLSSIFLLFDNRRKTDELAGLQNERQNDLQNKENSLQNQLTESQKRESQLKNQIDSERETSGDLTDQLESERQKRAQIETELERLRHENAARPTPQPQTPVIASIFLSPGIGTRGGGTVFENKNFTFERGTKRIVVRLALPADASKDERFSVQLNEKTAARDIAVRVSGSGQKALQLTVSPNDLLDGANKLTVLSATGAEISKYVFNVQRISK